MTRAKDAFFVTTRIKIIRVFKNELPVILNLFRDYRAKILEEQNRNSFFDK